MSMNYSAQESGRPQPQTTIEPAQAGSPFIRYSQPGRAPQYVVSGSTLGATITQPLVARPGYARQLRITQQLYSTGSNGGTLVADGMPAVNSLVQCRDAFGTPLLVVDGWSAAVAIPFVAGSLGVLNGTNNYQNLPSYSAYSNSGTSGSLAGQFSFSVPFEATTGVGTLSMANASLLPTLQFNLNSSTGLLGSSGTTNAPTVTTNVELDYYWLPEGSPDITPPGLGTTRQYQLTNLNPTLASGTSARLQAPRTGGYLDNLTFIFRDSTGARSDAPINQNGRLQLYVDGVPLSDSSYWSIIDDEAIAYGASSAVSNARPTGLLSYCRKTSLGQVSFGKFDSSESLLSTNPSTLIELLQSPWGTFTNTPATVQALFGQIVPTGQIIQGLPEVG